MNRKKRGKREHGAVTVFLTLILVPCIVFTCAFGDVSRVELSRSQAEAAGDLALYSLLAHYDEELKEWYGLVASCQSIDEFYKVTENYFIGMLDANGIEGTAGETLVSYLSAARNGDFSNFLQLNGLDSVKVTEVPNSGMGSNPALIEDGIVEFMKYRGPVTIVQDIIERFKLLNNQDMNDTDKNEPITEAKKQYASAEGDMMEDVLHTYLAIQAYMDYRAEKNIPSRANYSKVYNDLRKIYKDFEEVVKVVTSYYAATKTTDNFQRTILHEITGGMSYGQFPLPTLPDRGAISNNGDSFRVNGFIYRMTDDGSEVNIGATKAFDEDGNTIYVLTEDKFQEIYINLENNKKKVDNHRNEIIEGAKQFVDDCRTRGLDRGPGKYPNANGINEAVYCLRMQQMIEDENSSGRTGLNRIMNSGKALMQIYAKLCLADLCVVPEGEDQEARSKKIQDLLSEIEVIHRDYLSYNKGTNSTFENQIRLYTDIAKDVVRRVDQEGYEINSTFCGTADGPKRMSVMDFLWEVYKYLTDLVKDLDNQIANIDRIVNGGWITEGGTSYEVLPLVTPNSEHPTTLKMKIKTAREKRDQWGNTAKNTQTGYAQQEVAEYESLDPETVGKFAAAVYQDGEEGAEILNTRLLNIKEDMLALRKALTEWTYGEYPLVDYVETTLAIGLGRSKGGIPSTIDTSQPDYIDISLQKNNEAAKGYYQKLISPNPYEGTQEKPGQDGNEPDLMKDQPLLYKAMTDSIDPGELSKATDEVEATNEANKKNDDNAKSEADNAQDPSAGGFLDDKGIDPIEVDSTEGFSAKVALEGLVAKVTELASGDFTSTRDQIYVCSYIMNMFSYASYNNEGRYKLCVKSGSDYPNYSNYKQKYANVDSKWKETAVDQFTGNKSLTNRMINSQFNRSNLGEVEYILYGNSSFDENLRNAYTNIYAIRFLVNTVSGFVNYYSDSAISTIAGAVMSATMGIIPIPVTKVALIGLMAVLESAHDLNRLKAGLPVAIYKAKGDWVFAISGEKLSDVANVFKKGLQETQTDPNGMFYSEYLLVFLLLASNSPSQYKAMLTRVGDVIEGNLNPIPEEGKTDGARKFDLENAHCYFQLKGDVAVKPLLLDIPLVLNFSGDGVDKVLEAKGWCSYKLDIVRGYS